MKLAEAVAELNPVEDLRQAVLAVELSPLLLRRHYQLEGLCQPGLATEATFGTLRAVSNGRDGAFNRIRCSDVLPVFGRIVVKGQQRLAIPDQLATFGIKAVKLSAARFQTTRGGFPTRYG